MFIPNNHEIGRCQQLHYHDLKEVMEIEFPAISSEVITIVNLRKLVRLLILNLCKNLFTLVAKLLHVQEMNIKWWVWSYGYVSCKIGRCVNSMNSERGFYDVM